MIIVVRHRFTVYFQELAVEREELLLTNGI